MPKLTPTDLVLTSKILAAGENQEPQNFFRRDLDLKLTKHQMTTDDCLETLSSIMQYSKKEANKIAVAKLGLEMNGALKEEKTAEEEDKVPNIQFVFQDSNVNLNGIFNPKR